MGALGLDDLGRHSLGDDLAAGFASLGAEVDHPVCGGDKVEVVLDDQHCVAAPDQALKYPDQAPHVRHVQADCWLLKEEEVFPRVGVEPGSVVAEAVALVEELVEYPDQALERIKTTMRAYDDESADAWFDRATQATTGGGSPPRAVT